MGYSKNYSNMALSHTVWSFRNRLIQRRSLTGTQVLPANLLCCGLLSPQDHRSCQEPASVWTSHGVTASFGCIYLLLRKGLHGLQVDICPTVDLHGLQGDSLPHYGLHRRLQENLCSSAQNASSLWMQVLLYNFPPFLNMLSQRHYHHHWLAWPWLAVGPSWSWLALALPDPGEASSSCSQKPSLQPPCYQNFAMETQ